MNIVGRRQMLKLGAVVLTSAVARPLRADADCAPLAAGDDPEAAQFFLQVLVAGGMDTTYLFDSRTNPMHDAGLQHTYIKDKTTETWTAPNGTSTEVTNLVQELGAFRDDLAIVNGVVMDTAFDGHSQNLNTMFTGSPFGGEIFLTLLNHCGQAYRTPLDLVRTGDTPSQFPDLTGDRGVLLTPSIARMLVGRMNGAPSLTADDRVARLLRDRLDANSAASISRFARGSRTMRTAFDGSAALVDRLGRLDLGKAGDDPFLDTVKLIGELFRTGTTRAVMVTIEPTTPATNFDTHSAIAAQQQPAMYQTLDTQLAGLLQSLKTTPFDDHRSLLDVTTVAISTEFSRTMRQKGADLANTGTDHNELTNTLLFAGRGIRGGTILGASDFQAPDETLSGAHLAMDPDRIKLMGRPFDFAGQRPRDDRPDAFVATDYLGIGSVVNTLFSLFGVDPSHARPVVKGGPTAPILTGLLRG